MRFRTTPSAARAVLSETPLPDLVPDGPRWPGHSVTVAGTELFVRVTPSQREDAEPALCVHGLGGSSNDWTDLAGQLSGRLAVEALDLPGFGRSGPPPDGKYSIDAQARTVEAYLMQSGRGPVHLIGNSMGGAIALQVAARRPDLVRTLSLISPAVPDVRRWRAHPVKSDPWLLAVIIPGLGEFLLRQAGRKIPVARRVAGTIQMCFADPSRFPESRMAQAIEETEARLELAWANAALLRATRGLARTQFLQARRTWRTIRSIRTPTLVIWGDTDRLVASDLAPFVAGAIPEARLVVLDHVGHTAMLEDPVTTARAVLGLIEDADAENAGAENPGAGHASAENAGAEPSGTDAQSVMYGS